MNTNVDFKVNVSFLNLDVLQFLFYPFFSLQDLITRLASDLNLPKEIITATLEELRQHAVDKLAARKKFQEDGITSLKVKLTGSIPTNISRTGFNVETKLDVSSTALKQM